MTGSKEGRYITPFAAIIGGARFVVRASAGDEPGNFTLEHGDARIPVDHPSDLLAAAPAGERVTADYGAFTLTVWQGEDGRPRYRAAAQGKEPAEDDDDEERACWRLLALLGDASAPRACFFCRWSEVEPSAGWGNLGCAVESATAYDAIARSTDSRRRKWGPQGLLEWVDEWAVCERFEVRPLGYGYRGRPTI